MPEETVASFPGMTKKQEFSGRVLRGIRSSCSSLNVALQVAQIWRLRMLPEVGRAQSICQDVLIFLDISPMNLHPLQPSMIKWKAKRKTKHFEDMIRFESKSHSKPR